MDENTYNKVLLSPDYTEDDDFDDDDDDIEIDDLEDEGASETLLDSYLKEEKKEESESVKALKKGAGIVGGFFKKGWGAVKSGAHKANEKFKETEVS